MKNVLLVTIIAFSLFSCKSKKKGITNNRKPPKTVQITKTVKSNNAKKPAITKPSSNDIKYTSVAKKIIDNAKLFEGVRYAYGGTTINGMDCSGLVFTSFKQENITLPRTTGEQSKIGNWVDLKEVKKGDLLFFATTKNSRTVNHVGIVTQSRVGFVEFIHASSSKGVIISNLSQKYWYFAFVQARRVLQ